MDNSRFENAINDLIKSTSKLEVACAQISDNTKELKEQISDNNKELKEQIKELTEKGLNNEIRLARIETKLEQKSASLINMKNVSIFAGIILTLITGVTFSGQGCSFNGNNVRNLQAAESHQVDREPQSKTLREE